MHLKSNMAIQSSFSQKHKIGNIATIANFVFLIYLQFPSLFTTYVVSKYEIRCQWVPDN